MRIRLADPALIGDLRRRFERSGFVTNGLAEDLIELGQPARRDQLREARAIEGHVAVWRAMQPQADVELLP